MTTFAWLLNTFPQGKDDLTEASQGNHRAALPATRSRCTTTGSPWTLTDQVEPGLRRSALTGYRRPCSTSPCSFGVAETRPREPWPNTGSAMEPKSATPSRSASSWTCSARGAPHPAETVTAVQPVRCGLHQRGSSPGRYAPGPGITRPAGASVSVNARPVRNEEEPCHDHLSFAC